MTTSIQLSETEFTPCVLEVKKVLRPCTMGDNVIRGVCGDLSFDGVTYPDLLNLRLRPCVATLEIGRYDVNILKSGRLLVIESATPAVQ